MIFFMINFSENTKHYQSGHILTNEMVIMFFVTTVKKQPMLG